MWAAVYGVQEATTTLNACRTPEQFAALRVELTELRARAAKANEPTRGLLATTLDGFDALVTEAESGGMSGRSLTAFTERFETLYESMSR